MATKMALFTTMADIESRFDIERIVVWMLENWHVSLYISAAYLVAVFAGKYWMQKRPAYQLHRALFLWNFTLAAFSIVCFAKLGPNLVRRILANGFAHTSCFCDAIEIPRVAVWGYIFALSKVAELGDTAFIVLRKKPLTFLHYYHHMTVFVYCWFSLGRGLSATSQWFSAVNCLVHSFMYTYYTLHALGWRIPSRVALGITLLQLSQMFVGIFVNVLSYRTKYNNNYERPCKSDDMSFLWALIMYASYMVLFINFFIQRYMCKRRHRTKATAPTSNTKLESNNVHTAKGSGTTNGISPKKDN